MFDDEEENLNYR